MNARQALLIKKFSILQKVAQHGFLYVIDAGILQAIRVAVHQYEKEPLINGSFYGPGLSLTVMVHELLWLYSYKNDPLLNAKKLINGGTGNILAKLAKRFAVKCVSSSPIYGIAYLEKYKIINISDPFIRDMAFYALPASLFSMLFEALYDHKFGFFYSGASIGYHLASHTNIDHHQIQRLEQGAIELTKSTMTCDPDGIAWYQYLARILDNVTVAISLAEIFLMNGIMEDEEARQIHKVPHLFLILATILIFFANMGIKWAFTPSSESLLFPDDRDRIDDGDSHESASQARSEIRSARNVERKRSLSDTDLDWRLGQSFDDFLSPSLTNLPIESLTVHSKESSLKRNANVVVSQPAAPRLAKFYGNLWKKDGYALLKDEVPASSVLPRQHV